MYKAYIEDVSKYNINEANNLLKEINRSLYAFIDTSDIIKIKNLMNSVKTPVWMF